MRIMDHHHKDKDRDRSHVKRLYQMEPYELSQDLIDKQLELLEKKYGGAHRAFTAALTIQRAFRRYSMAKKFAHITAQMKTEKRISRRLDYREVPINKTVYQSVQQPAEALKRPYLKLNESSPALTSLDGNPSDGESSGLIQSFPLDETSVYTHHHLLQFAKSTPKNSHDSRDNSPQSSAKKKLAPDVPKRTVSRLSSSDRSGPPEKPPKTRSLSATTQPSHQYSKSSSSRHHVHHQSTGGGGFYPEMPDCRLAGSSRGYPLAADASNYTVNEVIRKRHYRTGLNIFNKKPEKGITYLIRRGFLENSPQAVARFLITRKGLSKQMIGEYLGNITYSFNMAVLNCFAQEMDFSGLHIDTALRKFQTYFRMPGEAQKIERLMEVFSGRYCQCNPDVVAKLHANDTVFILAFAIILLNTDLHTPSIKADKRMKLEDFVKNLRQIDDGHDLDPSLLAGIYERIRNQEFRPGSDHVTQVMKVQQTIVAKCPNLAVPHRRLVCYCRLYEVHDPHKKERPGAHQREVFLFNDILVITKIHSRKKNTVTYGFRQSYPLAGMVVNLFETQFYPYGIQIAQKWDRKVVLTLNARNDHDRSKFVEDLRESIAEMDEMEALRLEAELEKQRGEKRDSGIDPSPEAVPELRHGDQRSNGVLRKSAINNSLLDLTDGPEKMTRRPSIGSLDSGMSISFQSNSVGSICHKNNNDHHHHHHHDRQQCIHRTDRR